MAWALPASLALLLGQKLHLVSGGLLCAGPGSHTWSVGYTAAPGLDPMSPFLHAGLCPNPVFLEQLPETHTLSSTNHFPGAICSVADPGGEQVD